MSGAYIDVLDPTQGVMLIVEFETRRAEVTDYAVVLAIEDQNRRVTVRVYDGAHRRNELHRYSRTRGKQPAEVFHRGTLGEGMRTAIAEVRNGYGAMIEGWRAQ